VSSPAAAFQPSRLGGRAPWVIGVGLVAAAIVAAWLGSILAVSGHLALLALVPGLFLPVLVWHRPAAGPVLLVGIATLIEQTNASGPTGLLTGGIPLFSSLQAQLQLQGVFVNPVELFMALVLMVWLLRQSRWRSLRFPQSPVARSMVLLITLIAVAEVWGMVRGGSSTWSLWEIRPWIYLAACYSIGVMFVRDAATRRLVLWTFAIGTGIKGVQGVINAIALEGQIPRPEAILAHEEAVFFGIFIVLVAALWVFGDKGRLRIFCTVILPFVLYADLANNRRTTWLIVAIGLILLGVLAYVRLPERRRFLTTAAVVTLVVGSVYTSIFWNSTSVLAQPARSISSVFAPNPRDQSSNIYRVLEDQNLQLNILNSFPFGEGFGVPIQYRIPIQDLSGNDPTVKYVPHDTLLWVWLRLGVVGFIAFWMLIGAILMKASWLARWGDRGTALVATVVIAAVVAYLVEGTYDYGFYWLRVAMLIGILAGTIEGMRATARGPVTDGAPARLSRRLSPATGRSTK
jgi:O-antigen ligase/polysaccharide polymerase Wzy-like membrane protein